MRHLNSWTSDDHRVLLSFTPEVLDVFSNHVQALGSDTEAGGILLGQVRGRHLEVLRATAPSVWDRRFRSLFERLHFVHRSAAEAAWRASSGTVRYIGEWHTHPQDVPTPSALDRQEWRKLVASRSDGRALLAVIVGRKSMHVELVQRDGASVPMKWASEN